jgi:hypothetical protein
MFQPQYPVQQQQQQNQPLINQVYSREGKNMDKLSQPANATAFNEKAGTGPLVQLTGAELENIPGVNADKYKVKPKEGKKAAVKKCQDCGCTDFARNPFKETSCANCFHIH